MDRDLTGATSGLPPHALSFQDWDPSVSPLEAWEYDPPTDSPRDLILRSGNRLRVPAFIVDVSAGSASVDMLAATTGTCTIKFGDTADDDVGRIVYDHATNSMALWTGGVSRALLKANVFGFGTTDLEAWASTWQAIQSVDSTLAFSSALTAHLIVNAYYDGAWKYRSTERAAVLHVDAASRYMMLRTVASGTVDTEITWQPEFVVQGGTELLFKLGGAAGGSNRDVTLSWATDAYTWWDESGSILDDVLPAGGLRRFNSGIVQETYSIRKVFIKVLSDNIATAVFTITTANETGNADGGVYSCHIRGMVSHAGDPGSGSSADKAIEAQFCRAVQAAGNGVCSTVSEMDETASAATSPAVRDLGTVTITVAEISEYQVRVEVTADFTGSAIASGYAVLSVEVLYYGFTTPPVLAAA